MEPYSPSSPSLKRARETPLQFVTASLDIMLGDKNVTYAFARAIYYALAKTTLSHPDYDGGNSFTIERTIDIMDWLSAYLGGGKAVFKFAASVQESRVGTITKPVAKLLKDAGFVFTVPPKKARKSE